MNRLSRELAALIGSGGHWGRGVRRGESTSRHYDRGPSEKMQARYKGRDEHNAAVELKKAERHAKRIERDRLGLRSISDLPGETA